jgi:ArsR family transcriptional regulator
MSVAFENLLPRLRAIAEPTRLRLLAVLACGEFSVSELMEILGQSQPRISRHLKLLDDCGLLERFREQHWMYYRVADDTEGGRLARLLLDQLDANDPALAGDFERMGRVLEVRAGRSLAGGADTGAAESHDLVPLIAAELGKQGQDALLYFGVAPDEVLAGLGSRARRAVGMNPSRMVVQRARARLHSAGLNHCVLQRGELAALPHPSHSFDVAVVDRVLAAADRPAEALREVARVLRPSSSRTSMRWTSARPTATRSSCCAPGSPTPASLATVCVRSMSLARTCCSPWPPLSPRQSPPEDPTTTPFQSD